MLKSIERSADCGKKQKHQLDFTNATNSPTEIYRQIIKVHGQTTHNDLRNVINMGNRTQ